MDGWANDEAFVATELQNNDFECSDLAKSAPGCYTRHTMRTDVPWDRDELAARAPDEILYHPVRSFSVWFEQISKWAANYAISRRGKRHVHFRADIRKLDVLASSSSEHLALRDASLFPLMLVSRMAFEASHVDEAGRLGPYRETEVRADRAIRALTRRFHPRRNGRSFATAHLLTESKDGNREPIAAPTDFLWSDTEPLRAPPLAFSLPYACDFNGNSLLFTVHPVPQAILLADCVVEEHRRQACVGCRVDFRHLHRFYPLPSPLPVISFLLVEDSAARVEASRRLRASGKRAMADPPALVQLAKQSGQFFGLRRRWWNPVIWATIAPVFSTYGATGEPMVFVVSENVLVLRTVLQTVLGDVPFTHDFDEAAKIHYLKKK
jgi:hypothetical protein